MAMASAWLKDRKLVLKASNYGITLTEEDARILRRAELTLHGWYEQKCGMLNKRCSWSIERDEETGKAYRCTYPNHGEPRREPIADREAGAVARVSEVCERLGLYYYVQTDPLVVGVLRCYRGCALYVGRDELTPSNYSGDGVPCEVI
jgi:hypothetical protein